MDETELTMKRAERSDPWARADGSDWLIDELFGTGGGHATAGGGTHHGWTRRTTAGWRAAVTRTGRRTYVEPEAGGSIFDLLPTGEEHPPATEHPPAIEHLPATEHPPAVEHPPTVEHPTATDETVFAAQPADNPDDRALADLLSHGGGTPTDALHYFQTHGYPFLHTLPTWDGTTGLWQFGDPGFAGGHIVDEWLPGDDDEPAIVEGGGTAPPAVEKPTTETPAAQEPTVQETTPAGDVHPWNPSRADRWRAWWGDQSGLAAGAGTGADPLVFRDDFIHVRPPTGASTVTAAPERPYATADEEWAVAKESAWNWLVDKVIHGSPLAPDWLRDWRYDEPSDAARTGRTYELRQSYEAMQTFLDVFEFGVTLVSPAIVESALSNGLPSRFGEFLSALAADETGAIGSLAARQRAQAVLEANGEAATETAMKQYLRLERAYNTERASLAMDARPFEGFEEHIFRQGGRTAEVNIGYLRGSYAADFKAANQAMGWNATPEGWTWHHHPDMGRMVLIPTDIHAQIGHWGGVSIWKRTFGSNYP